VADNGVAPDTDPVAPTPAVRSDESETDAPELHRRPPRRRNRRRGDRRVPPHASTDIADIAPDGWSPEMLAAEQLADGDLSQLKKWKTDEVKKPTGFELRGSIPTLKAYCVALLLGCSMYILVITEKNAF